jgi:Fe-coproporphyrin III synthase
MSPMRNVGGQMDEMMPLAELAGGSLRTLPLATLYLTDRCNSRCITCDYWRHGRSNLTLQSLTALLPSVMSLGTEIVVLSGGEPLLNPEWAEIAGTLRAHGLKLWLLTSGLSLAKHASRVAALFDAVTVSLDGTSPKTYAAIRGLDAFDNVCAGIRAATAAGLRPSIRVTVQRANYRELSRFVTLAREIGARQVSFLAVDVGNAHAFARVGDLSTGLALAPEDLPQFQQILETLAREHAEHFESGFIAESPRKLRRILQYFSALCGEGAFPTIKCNAPDFSAVITADLRVQPCFFIPGPATIAPRGDLNAMLNNGEMRALRLAIAAGERPECKRCVCSMWRSPQARHSGDFLTQGRVVN